MPFFDVFKKKSANEKNINDHCTSLMSRYIEYARRGSTAHFDPEKTFRNFPDNQSFLSHLGTGYESTYSLLENYVLLNREINTKIMPEPIWKEKTKQVNGINLEFRHEFEKLLLKIERGAEEFGGICEECRKWHSEDNPNSRELLSKLKAFKMPF
jgi:hypothetical protein